VVSPEGPSTNAQEVIIRARHRESSSAPRPITPGEVHEYRIDLGPTAYIFKAGHRVRLQVSSGDFPTGTGTSTPAVH
jgi:predicted acyl esterase